MITSKSTLSTPLITKKQKEYGIKEKEKEDNTQNTQSSELFSANSTSVGGPKSQKNSSSSFFSFFSNPTLKFNLMRISSLSNSIKKNTEKLFQKNSKGKIDISEFNKIAKEMGTDFSTLKVFIEFVTAEKTITKDQYDAVHTNIKLVEQQFLKLVQYSQKPKLSNIKETQLKSNENRSFQSYIKKEVTNMFRDLQECKAFLMSKFSN